MSGYELRAARLRLTAFPLTWIKSILSKSKMFKQSYIHFTLKKLWRKKKNFRKCAASTKKDSHFVSFSEVVLKVCADKNCFMSSL